MSSHPGKEFWPSLGQAKGPRTVAGDSVGTARLTIFGDGKLVNLGNGKVLLAGGLDATLTPLATCELYDQATGAWAATGAMPEGKDAPCVRLQDGRVLVAGGATTGFASSAVCALYDPTTGAWTATGSLGTARAAHALVLLATGKVLAVGGHDSGGTPMASCELYDPAAGTWAATGSLAAARNYVRAARLVDGTVMVAGGATTGGALIAACELYTPAAGTWASAGSLTAARAFGDIVVSGSTVLVAGGSDALGGSRVAGCEKYAGGGSWVAAGSLTVPRNYASLVALADGNVAAIAGNDASDVSAAVEVYNVATNTWTLQTTLQTERSQHYAVLLDNGQVLVATGADAVPTPMASSELYWPSSYTQASLSDLLLGPDEISLMGRILELEPDAHLAALSSAVSLAGGVLSLTLTGDLTVQGTTVLQSTTTVSGVAKFAAGAVGAPSITDASDLVKGVYFTGTGATGELNIAINGVRTGVYSATGLGVRRAPRCALESSALANDASPPILGAFSANAALMLTNADPYYGMIAGILNSGNGYIQVQRFDGTATAYDLLLQPNGGNVGIGVSGTPGYKLEVNGTAYIADTLKMAVSKAIRTGYIYNDETSAQLTISGGHTASDGVQITAGGGLSKTSGVQNGLNVGAFSFAPASGNADFHAINLEYTVNQTGGANGTITGLYLDATETALVGSHDLLSLRVAGSPKFRVTNGGSAISSKVGGGSAAGVISQSMSLYDGTAGVDAKYWDYNSSSGTFNLRAVNDANDSAQAALTITRSGATITNVVFPNGKVGVAAATPVGKLDVSLDNTDYTNTLGANTHILLTNPNASGQTVMGMLINGVLRSKWRGDSTGNVNWVAIGGGHHFFVGGDYGVGTDAMFITTAANVGIATATPTARLHLPAGTAAVGTAPLKIPPGTVLAATESGAIESDGTHLYWTDSGGTRRQLDN